MKIAHFPNFLPTNQDLVYPQLLDAIQSTDELVEGSTREADADAALIWSVLWFGKMSGNKQVWDKYRAAGKPVIVIEVGGLVRNGTWKLGINGVNRDADFALDVGVDPNRVKHLGIKTLPWVIEDKPYILVCGQHAYSLQWQDMPDMDTYFRNTVEDIRHWSDKPIVLRAHPRYRERIHFPIADEQWYIDRNCEWQIAKKVQETYDSFDLEDQLKETNLTVSYSSNAGVNSIIQGIPAVVSKHSLAWDMTSTFKETMCARREKWLINMCNIEYLPEEIGTQWLRIRSKL